MNYVLEHSEEFDRLEKQSTLPGYSLETELKDIHFAPNSMVLDAGCGSGLLSRHLALKHGPYLKIHGCDASELRLKQASNYSKERGLSHIHFFHSDITNLNVKADTYDYVICRYVLEHLPSPVAAAKEAHRVLKPGGKYFAIDMDGMVFNIYSSNARLMQLLEKMQQSFNFDLYVGRKIPALLEAAGFKNITWKVQLVEFTAGIESELELTAHRLTFAKPTIEKALGSVSETEEFIDLYLNEMQKPTSTLFYNKFIVEGQK